MRKKKVPPRAGRPDEPAQNMPDDLVTAISTQPDMLTSRHQARQAASRQAAQLEQQGDYDQASLRWLAAYGISWTQADRDWCSARAQWCQKRCQG